MEDLDFLRDIADGLAPDAFGRPHPPKVVPKDHLGPFIRMINIAMFRRANESLRSAGVTFTQANVLHAIEMSDGGVVRLKELERLFDVAQATMHGTVARLEEKGLVETRVDPADRRAKEARLTKAGVEVSKKCLEGALASEKSMLRGFSGEEAAQLKSLLCRVYDNINGGAGLC